MKPDLKPEGPAANAGSPTVLFLFIIEKVDGSDP